MSGVVILGGVLIVTAAIAVLYNRHNGRIRGAGTAGPATASNTSAVSTSASSTSATSTSATSTPAIESVLAGLVPPSDARVTLVQFSTSFCAPCRATKRILGEIASVVPGVVHLEIDAESHLEAVRALDVRRTPTTLILDADRQVVARASGQPKRDEVMATLVRILEPST